MKLPTLFPLTLAIAAAIAVPALAADAPLPSASLQPGDLDPSVSACTDLNAFVNGKWLAANPVPADRTTWGSFEILGERSLAIQHELVQAAAANGWTIMIHMRTRAEDYGAQDVEIFLKEVLPHAGGSPVFIAHSGGWGGPR